MRKFSQDTLWKILKAHRLWIESKGKRGRRANLSMECLSGANFSGANLSEASFSEADLFGANLCGANLQRANLYGANLYEANLYGANLQRADLYRANLLGADLRVATAKDCWIKGAKFSSPKERARLIMLGAYE